MSTGQPSHSRPYLHLLEAAYSLGLADGGLAAMVEPAGPVGPLSRYSQGRDPEEFARHLWADRPGTPPSGLELNAPLWYARGFAEALTAARHRVQREEAAAGAAGGSPDG